MARQRKKKAGVGAKCTIITRFLHPKDKFGGHSNDKQHRSIVTLLSKTNTKINKRDQECYVCSVPGIEECCYAVKKHFVVFEEGDKQDFFEPLTEAEKEQDRQASYSEKFKEPKVRWKKSNARKVLFDMLLEGIVPGSDEDTTMPIDEVYLLHPEFALYDFQKFPERLSKLGKSLNDMIKRANDDLLAFNIYKSNHKPSLVSHKGYIQWQGSNSRELLLDDILAGKHEEMTPMELWNSRPEFRDEFPLHAFRSKLEQERRTSKYLHTLRVRGILHKAS
ncbi:MAG: hypothetical protein AAGM67_00550 [Bacteroidota bacterium]